MDPSSVFDVSSAEVFEMSTLCLELLKFLRDGKHRSIFKGLKNANTIPEAIKMKKDIIKAHQTNHGELNAVERSLTVKSVEGLSIAAPDRPMMSEKAASAVMSGFRLLEEKINDETSFSTTEQKMAARKFCRLKLFLFGEDHIGARNALHQIRDNAKTLVQFETPNTCRGLVEALVSCAEGAFWLRWRYELLTTWQFKTVQAVDTTPSASSLEIADIVENVDKLNGLEAHKLLDAAVAEEDLGFLKLKTKKLGGYLGQTKSPPIGADCSFDDKTLDVVMVLMVIPDSSINKKPWPKDVVAAVTNALTERLKKSSGDQLKKAKKEYLKPYITAMYTKSKGRTDGLPQASLLKHVWRLITNLGIANGQQSTPLHLAVQKEYSDWIKAIFPLGNEEDDEDDASSSRRITI